METDKVRTGKVGPEKESESEGLNQTALKESSKIESCTQVEINSRISYLDLLGTEIRRYNGELVGHTGSVQVVILTYDDRFAISGSSDTTIRLWSILTMKECLTLRGHKDAVNHLIVSRDSKRLFSASADKTVKIWNLSTGKFEKNLIDSSDKLWNNSAEIHERNASESNEVISLDYHDEHEKVLVTFKLFGLKIFNLKEDIISNLESKKDLKITYSKFLKNTNEIIVGYENGNINIFNDSLGVSYALNDHKEKLTCLAVQFKENYFASSSSNSTDNKLKIWKKFENKFKLHCTFTTSEIVSISFGGDSHLVYCCKGSFTMYICDFVILRKVLTFNTLMRALNSVAFNLEGSYIVSALREKNLKVFTLESRRDSATLFGHQQEVTDLGYSNSKGLLFSSSGDSLMYWSIYDSSQGTKIQGIEQKITAFAFSPDSKYIVYGTDPLGIGFVNIFSKKNIQMKLEKLTSVQKAFCISSDSKMIASEGNEINIWELIDYKNEEKYEYKLEWKFCLNIENSAKNPKNLTFFLKNSFLMSLSGPVVNIWNLNEKKISSELKEHTGTINYLKLDQNNNFLYTCSDDKSIRKWNLSKFSQEFVFPIQKNEVKSIDLSKDEKILISSSAGTIFAWDLDTLSLLCKFESVAFKINKIIFIQESRSFAAGGSDFSIKIYDIKRDSNRKINYQPQYVQSKSLGHMIYNVCFTKDEKKMYVSGFSTNLIKLYDIDDNYKNIETLTGHTNSVVKIILLEERKILISASFDGSIKLWELQFHKEWKSLKAHNNWIKCILLSNNEKLLFSGSSDNTLKCWDFEEILNAEVTEIKKEKEEEEKGKEKKVKTEKNTEISVQEKFSLVGHTFDVNRLEINQKDSLLISCSSDRRLKVWNIEKKEEFKSVEKLVNYGWLVKLIQDEKFIATCLINFKIQIYSFPECDELFSLTGHTNSVYALTETPDKKFLISAGADFVIRVWNFKERRIEFSLLGHYMAVWNLIISKDSKRLFSGGNDWLFKSWNLSCREDRPGEIYQLGNSHKIKRNDTEFIDVYSEKGSILSSWTSSSCFDPYYQSTLSFYNVIDALQTDKYDGLFSGSSNIFFGKFRFTVIHFMSFLGKIEPFDVLLNPQCVLSCDVFGKSPFYYAINKKYQHCVDAILAFLVTSSEDADKSNYFTSIYAIRNDFYLLVENCSTNLHSLLKGLMIRSPLTFAKAGYKLPKIIESDHFFHNISYFDQKSSKLNSELGDPSAASQEMLISGTSNDDSGSTPVYITYSLLELPLQTGKDNTLRLLQAIEKCGDKKVFKSEIIKYFIDYQWTATKKWAIFFSVLWFLNLANLLILIDDKNFEKIYFLLSFITINCVLILWESIQIYVFRFEYFMNYWNYIDMSRIASTVIWLFAKNYSSDYLAWVVIMTNFLRGLSAFNIFDGTRYYVRLILHSIDFAKYFIVMFIYSTLAFGAMFVIVGKNSVSFDSLWMLSYGLNFGIYESNSSALLKDLIYIISTFINIIVMLNLLISILGDYYDQFQGDKDVIDLREKASFSLEIQKMMFWIKGKGNLKFLHVMKNITDEENNDDLEEKIFSIEKKIDSINKNILDAQGDMKKEIVKSIDGLSKNIEEKIKDSIAQMLASAPKK